MRNSYFNFCMEVFSSLKKKPEVCYKYKFFLRRFYFYFILSPLKNVAEDCSVGLQKSESPAVPGTIIKRSPPFLRKCDSFRPHFCSKCTFCKLSKRPPSKCWSRCLSFEFFWPNRKNIVKRSLNAISQISSNRWAQSDCWKMISTRKMRFCVEIGIILAL